MFKFFLRPRTALLSILPYKIGFLIIEPFKDCELLTVLGRLSLLKAASEYFAVANGLGCVGLTFIKEFAFLMVTLMPRPLPFRPSSSLS